MSCYFSACCIASGEPAQIHRSISKMEIQKKIWTSRYKKGALTVAFVHTCVLTACADPGIFVKGVRNQHGHRFLVVVVVLVLNLSYRENYTFPRIKRGSASSRGRVQMFISIEPHITCDFLGGGGGQTLYPPSGSAHEQRDSKTDRNRSLNMWTG